MWELLTWVEEDTKILENAEVGLKTESQYINHASSKVGQPAGLGWRSEPMLHAMQDTLAVRGRSTSLEPSRDLCRTLFCFPNMSGLCTIRSSSGLPSSVFRQISFTKVRLMFGSPRNSP